LSGAQRSPQALVRAILVHAHRAILVHAHRAILVHAHRSLSRHPRPPVIVRRTVLFVLFMAYISIYYRSISTSFSSLSSHPRLPVIVRRTVARPPRRPDQVLLQQLLRQRPARPGPAERRVRLRNDGDRSAEPSNANKIFRRSSCGSARPGPARPGPARPGRGPSPPAEGGGATREGRRGRAVRTSLMKPKRQKPVRRLINHGL
jgi:hypothetical protein